jgi:hypothetical protein
LDSGISSSTKQPTTSFKSIPLKDSHNTVIHLEVLSRVGQKNVKEAAPEVIAVLENSTVICFTCNLEQELWRWEAQPTKDLFLPDEKAEPSRKVYVEYAILADWKDALSGLLALEDDHANSASSSSPFVLVFITRQALGHSQYQRAIEVLSIELDSIRSGDTDTSAFIRRVRKTELPIPGGISHEILDSKQINLDVRTGTLQVYIQESLLTFDLSKTTPNIRSQLTFDNQKSVSFQAVSPNLTLAISDSTRLYDTTFGSVQAILDLPGLEYINESQPPKKRKRSAAEDSKPVQITSLVASFPSLSTVIGVRGESLIGIRISTPSGAIGRAGKPPSTSNLIDSIRCGVKASRTSSTNQLNVKLPSALGRVITGVDSSSGPDWSALLSKMDRYVESGDIEAFEESFATRLGIYPGHTNQSHSRKQGKTPGLTNGLLENAEQLNEHRHLTNGIISNEANINQKDQQLLMSDARHNRRSSMIWPEKQKNLRDQLPLAEYAIRKMFLWKIASLETTERISQRSSNIEVVFFPPNVFHWVMQSGLLSLPRILQIIRGQNFADNDLAGHLSISLAAVDPEMQVLLQFLLSPMHLDAEELVHAIHLLVDSLGYKDVPASRVKQLLDTREDNLPNGDFDAMIQNEAYAADMDLDLAFSTLESGTPIREQALTCALTRLHSFSSATIVKVLRKALNRSSIIDIIHLLRMQLASGGWLAMYNNTYQDPDLNIDQSMSDRGILIICTFLNSALESIGMGVSAFEHASVQDGEVMEDLVISLKAEISAALEGVQESTYLEGIVGQFLGY